MISESAFQAEYFRSHVLVVYFSGSISVIIIFETGKMNWSKKSFADRLAEQ
jgi:hypothetical protein